MGRPADALLEEVTDRLVREFRPERVYLFGSSAWGSPRDESDLDLMVIVRDSAESPTAREARAYRALEGLRVRKDVLVRTRDEFDRRACVASLMESRILREGRLLYGM